MEFFIFLWYDRAKQKFLYFPEYTMNKTRQIAYISIFIALYFVLSSLLKIPVAGHITLDLGYIALMVGSVCFGKVPAMLIGALGAFLESALMSQRGVSPGWILMNAIVGFLCGAVLHKTVLSGKKKFLISAVVIVPVSMLLGVSVKTLVDCLMYDLALAAKIPSAVAALVADSAVMLLLGLPLSLSLIKRLKL